MEQRVADLRQVMRRDAGRHADGDALAAIGEQVGQAAGQHHRLLLLAVIGGAEIDRILVDAVEHRGGRLGEPRLGVSHGGGVIAVDIAEIALAVDQRVARSEILGQAHQSVIDRLVAMGMELADDIADHAGGFLEARAGVEAELAHGIEQPAMHRLQPVAHIGQGARHDGGEGIGEIALAEGIGERCQSDLLAGWAGGGGRLGHGKTSGDRLATGIAAAWSSA